MGDVEASFPKLKVLFRFRPLHGLDQAVIALPAVIKLPQAGDHLPGGEEVVLIVFVIHIVRIFSHDGSNQDPVAMVQGGGGIRADRGPGIVPEQLGVFVVGVDNGAFQELGVAVSADGLVQGDFPLRNPVQKQHIQRHLVHASAYTVLIPVVIVLFTGRQIIVSGRDGIGVRVVLLQHQQQPGLPVTLPGHALCRCASLRVRRFLLDARLGILDRILRPSGRKHGKQEQ